MQCYYTQYVLSYLKYSRQNNSWNKFGLKVKHMQLILVTIHKPWKYIANALDWYDVISSSDGTLKINFSVSTTQYIDNKAVHIYQFCYQEPTYHSFTIQDY